MNIFFRLALLLLCALVAPAAHAQQAVFNMPNADVLDRGKVYVELDAAFKINEQSALGRFSSFVPRAVVGAGRGVEIGVNLAGNVTPGDDALVLVPNVKYRFYRDERRKIALYAGQHFFVPLRKRAYRFGSYTYAAAAKTFKNTRLTAGGYVYSKSVVAPRAARAGGQFAVEHSVNDRLTLAADWYTGRHAAGYLTPGVIYKPHPQVTTYWSYAIGNGGAKNGNHFFLFELGYNF